MTNNTAPKNSLWNLPPHNGTPTSMKAARKIKPFVSGLRAVVYEAIRNSGARGLTDLEGEARTNIGGSTYRPRRIELADAGYIRKLGVIRDGAEAWVVTDKETM